MHPKHHYCLVFERLDASLRDFLKANDSVGLVLEDVRVMARQLLECLAFLHSIGLIHTDLKCRNVMLRDARHQVVPLGRGSGSTMVRSPYCCDIAVIDFGGACFMDELHDGRIGTRQYRAPEVVIGVPWDEKSDIWSAGCIVAMLYLGVRPFQVHESMEHLALMERIVGERIPPAMVRLALKSGSLPDGVMFDSNAVLAWPDGADDEAIEHVRNTTPLSNFVGPQHGTFKTLLQGLFDLDPARRLTAGAALQTPFFSSM